MQATVREMLNRWMEAQEAGRDLSARELCPDQPELAEELVPILGRWGA
jgi:hypothetical protein